MLRMQAATNVTLRSINQRLQKIENAIKHRVENPVNEDYNIVAPLLPLTTIERIKEFNDILNTSAESRTRFVSLYINLFYCTIALYYV
jgi:hypothetical protein